MHTAPSTPAWPWPDSLDAVIAGPAHHRVLLENDAAAAILAEARSAGCDEPRDTLRRVLCRGVLRVGLRTDYQGFSSRDAEGRLVLAGLTGSVTASIRRGPIEGTDVSGAVRLSTEMGAIALTGVAVSDPGVLRLRTFNGDIRLALAARPQNARILALALNGTIQSTIPLTVKDAWGPRWSEATLGRGEPIISLDVVNGTIQLTSP